MSIYKQIFENNWVFTRDYIKENFTNKPLFSELYEDADMVDVENWIFENYQELDFFLEDNKKLQEKFDDMKPTYEGIAEGTITDFSEHDLLFENCLNKFMYYTGQETEIENMEEPNFKPTQIPHKATDGRPEQGGKNKGEQPKEDTKPSKEIKEGIEQTKKEKETVNEADVLEPNMYSNEDEYDVPDMASYPEEEHYNLNPQPTDPVMDEPIIDPMADPVMDEPITDPVTDPVDNMMTEPMVDESTMGEEEDYYNTPVDMSAIDDLSESFLKEGDMEDDSIGNDFGSEFSDKKQPEDSEENMDGDMESIEGDNDEVDMEGIGEGESEEDSDLDGEEVEGENIDSKEEAVEKLNELVDTLQQIQDFFNEGDGDEEGEENIEGDEDGEENIEGDEADDDLEEKIGDDDNSIDEKPDFKPKDDTDKWEIVEHYSTLKKKI